MTKYLRFLCNNINIKTCELCCLYLTYSNAVVSTPNRLTIYFRLLDSVFEISEAHSSINYYKQIVPQYRDIHVNDLSEF